MENPLISLISRGYFVEKYIARELDDNPIAPEQQLVWSAECPVGVDALIEVEADGGVIVSDFRIDQHNPRIVRLKGHNVVGTGMTGAMGEMAKSIYRGNYFHIDGDETRLSVVHAVDVARAVRIALCDSGLSGDFVLTDGVNPLRRDLAEAFAYRMGDKRIFSISAARAARMVKMSRYIPFLPMSAKKYKMMTTDDTVDDSAWRSAVYGWESTPVVEYLRNHNYDENSL